MREQLNDELFEAVLRRAVYDAEKADLEELPTDAELNETFQLPEQAKKEFARVQKAQTRGISTRRLLARRVAIITVTAIAVIFGGLMLHPDIRAGVNRTVMQQFEKFALFTHSENGQAKPFLTVDDVIIGYQPEGYELEGEIVNETRRTYMYRNGANDYVISIVAAAWTDVYIDNEHHYEILYINNREMHFSYRDDVEAGAIVIPGEDVIVSIAGNLPTEELLKMAKNIH